jgi:hypothetical protein
LALSELSTNRKQNGCAFLEFFSPSSCLKGADVVGLGVGHREQGALHGDVEAMNAGVVYVMGALLVTLPYVHPLCYIITLCTV